MQLTWKVNSALTVPPAQPFIAQLGAQAVGARYEIAVGALPPGLTLDATTGAVSGTATQPGSYFFMLAASSANKIERTCWWFEARDGKVVRAWGEKCDPITVDSLSPPLPNDRAIGVAVPAGSAAETAGKPAENQPIPANTSENTAAKSSSAPTSSRTCRAPLHRSTMCR